MKYLVMLLVVGSSLLAQAEDSKFSCGNVGGTDEWTVYVDLNKKLAGFFDNDSTAVVPLINVTLLKSNPPQVVYVFEGQDTGGEQGTKLRITFNSTEMSADVTFDAGAAKAKTQKSLDGCVVDNQIDL